MRYRNGVGRTAATCTPSGGAAMTDRELETGTDTPSASDEAAAAWDEGYYTGLHAAHCYRKRCDHSNPHRTGPGDRDD